MDVMREWKRLEAGAYQVGRYHIYKHPNGRDYKINYTADGGRQFQIAGGFSTLGQTRTWLKNNWRAVEKILDRCGPV